MKPQNWDQMTATEKHDYAKRLAATTRGSYLFGQAFALARKVLLAEKYPELSNAQDMEVLATLFLPYMSQEDMRAAFEKLQAEPAKGDPK